LDKIITSAISGDDAEDLGAKIFDLSETGCNLRIKVETNEGGYPTYVASKFTPTGPLEGNPDTDEIYNSIKSLDSIFEHKSYEEISKTMNVHFLGKTESEPPTPKREDRSSSKVVEDDFEVETYNTNNTTSTFNSSDDENDSPIDDRIQSILQDL
jgi:hypothetical protein